MSATKHNGSRTNALRRSAPRNDGKAPTRSAANSYDAFKRFEGQRYTGMKVGRTHKWYYDQGEWREKKVTPDLWQVNYAVKKRRAGKAPEGSGVPVGTAYHWLIVAHQTVEKLDANVYDTALVGTKFKVAHKRAGSEKWSAGETARRRRMIKFLQQTIRELEEQDAKPAPARKAVRGRKRQPARA